MEDDMLLKIGFVIVLVSFIYTCLRSALCLFSWLLKKKLKNDNVKITDCESSYLDPDFYLDEDQLNAMRSREKSNENLITWNNEENEKIATEIEESIIGRSGVLRYPKGLKNLEIKNLDELYFPESVSPEFKDHCDNMIVQSEIWTSILTKYHEEVKELVLEINFINSSNRKSGNMLIQNTVLDMLVNYKISKNES